MTSKKSQDSHQIDYTKFTDDEKKRFIDSNYNGNDLSFAEISKLVDSYPNKIRRDAHKFGIKPKDKSKAQKQALESGRHKHPTKGIERSDETKFKISEKVADSWDNISDEERQRRSDVSKKQWESKTAEEKADFQKKALSAIHKAAKEGSKLEKYIHERLIGAGFKAQMHVENLILNERLQIDLMLPELNVVIEVDGPSHYSNIWGHGILEKNQKADAQKDGLLLGKGFVVIRLIQRKGLSDKYKRELWGKLENTLGEIKTSFPSVGNRRIILD